MCIRDRYQRRVRGTTKRQTMVFRLDGKLAVITGAASGIGLCIADLFTKQGAQVVILDLSGAEEAARTIAAKYPGSVLKGYDCNVADQAAVDQVFDQIAADHRIDILVNNAGIGHVGTLLETNGEDMDRMYNVNVKGVFHTLKAGVRNMVADGKGGAVCNLASIASLIGLPDRFAYQMSKGAVRTMTYSVGVDYVKSGVRCNAICPGRVHTPFVDGFLAKNYPGKEKEMFDKLSATQPIGRMGNPDEVAYQALYLCSDEAKFVNGTLVSCDGGQSKLLLACL
eukprot:TRINITY_DN1744_c0_g1_i2.p1 TRINITY_DN1744_c0_g1~~TRINITY_DN1744_c0_g1_i2.p1  ORF type:complete len:282 (-),score=78.76 TRINITY_DN1744_c0_g1_i2:262-1107(-)